jgi:toxin ParE1/3/4
MTRRLIFSRSSQRDLDETLLYIARDKPGAAVQFVKKLREKCQLLIGNPLLGEDCSEVRPQTRRLVYQKYLIFYRVTDATIEITRVIHGARDWPNLLQDD